MKVKIYWDILFLVNFFMNFYILWITLKLTRKDLPVTRLIVGALIGASYVLILLFPQMNFMTNHLTKFLLSMLIIIVTFYPKEPFEFLRLLGYFYIISFMVGGAAFAFFYLTDSGTVLSNGIFIFNTPKIPLWVLIISPLFVYITIRYSWEYIRQRFLKEDLLIPLQIVTKDNFASVKALVDTGNSLLEPISKLPVIIVEYQKIQSILPGQLCEVFSCNKENDLSTLAQLSPKYNLRIIPYTSLGNPSGMILGFKPDEIRIKNGDESYKRVFAIIGIFNGKLSRDNSYEALMNPEVLQ